MSIKQLFRVRTADRKVLAYLGPIFALVTASNVVTISFAKALFLAHNDTQKLPWMFISAAIFTMFLSLTYVALIGRGNTGSRFRTTLGIYAASFVLLGLLSRVNPASYSLLIFAWSTGVGQILMIQSWTWSAGCVPTHQARRLFPMFSAMATVGATLGGLLTKALTQQTGLIGLLFLTVILLLTAMFLVHITPDWDKATEPTEQTKEEEEKEQSASPSPFKRIPIALKALRKTPLLARIGMLVFLIQVASIVLDFQFSIAIQAQYTKAKDMAGFIGAYYAVANIATFVLAFVATGKLSRMLGIGLSSASAAIALALGGVLSSLVFLTGIGSSSLFWLVAGTSFAERIIGFAVAKQALQVATMPVDKEQAEPARFLIDGVVSRFAVVAVSLALLFTGTPTNYGSLSLPLLFTAVLAILIGLRLAPTYQQALLEALKQNRFSTQADFPDWARGEASNIVSKSLRSHNPGEVECGLLIAREMQLPLNDTDASNLLKGEVSHLAVTTLNIMSDQGKLPPQETIHWFLSPDRPVELICAMLRVLPHDRSDFSVAIQGLAKHTSSAVSAYAIKWSRGHRESKHRSPSQPSSTEASKHGPGSQTPETHLTVSPKRVDHGDTLGAQYVHLVDRIPALLHDEDENMRRLALDMLVEMALPEHVEMLFDALGDPRACALAMIALSRMQNEIVLEKLDTGLTEQETELKPRFKVRLLQLAERIGGDLPANRIEQHMDHRNTSIREQAVKSMWRLCDQDDVSIAPERKNVKGLILEEIKRLVHFAVLDSALSMRLSLRLRMLAGEAKLLRGLTERRLFRLLALIFPRSPIEQAWTHYRSSDRRVRSNAIELLDTTIKDPELRVVVSYAENTNYLEGRSETVGTGLFSIPAFSSAMKMLSEASKERSPIDVLLSITDDWLQKMHTYALIADEKDKADTHQEETSMAQNYDDVMDKLFLLRGVDLFNQVAADQLLPLAEVAVRRQFAADTVIFYTDESGDELYVVANGEVIIEREGQIVATLGPGDAFGEMAILDDAPRSATARVEKPTECLLVGQEDFGELLDIAPGLARGVMRVLTMRLRTTLEKINA